MARREFESGSHSPKIGALAGAFCGALNGASGVPLKLRHVLHDQGVMLDEAITHTVAMLFLESLSL